MLRFAQPVAMANKISVNSKSQTLRLLEVILSYFLSISYCFRVIRDFACDVISYLKPQNRGFLTPKRPKWSSINKNPKGDGSAW